MQSPGQASETAGDTRSRYEAHVGQHAASTSRSHGDCQTKLLLDEPATWLFFTPTAQGWGLGPRRRGALSRGDRPPPLLPGTFLCPLTCALCPSYLYSQVNAASSKRFRTSLTPRVGWASIGLRGTPATGGRALGRVGQRGCSPRRLYPHTAVPRARPGRHAHRSLVVPAPSTQHREEL